MKRSKYNSFNELPLMLTVQDVADVLGIGLAHAYEVAHRQDFPTITLGSRIMVSGAAIGRLHEVHCNPASCGTAG